MLPAFLTIVLMPFTYSIANGIGAGFVSYVVLQAARRPGPRGAPAALGHRRRSSSSTSRCEPLAGPARHRLTGRARWAVRRVVRYANEVVRSATIDTALASSLRLSVVRLNRRLRGQRADTSVTLTQLAALSTPEGARRADSGRAGGAREGAAAVDDQGAGGAGGARAGARAGRTRPTAGRCLVELTEAGPRAAAQRGPAREAWLARRLAELSAEEREVLRAASSVIDKLVASE